MSPLLFPSWGYGDETTAARRIFDFKSPRIVALFEVNKIRMKYFSIGGSFPLLALSTVS